VLRAAEIHLHQVWLDLVCIRHNRRYYAQVHAFTYANRNAQELVECVPLGLLMWEKGQLCTKFCSLDEILPVEVSHFLSHRPVLVGDDVPVQ
jgi:hypothetical protein